MGEVVQFLAVNKLPLCGSLEIEQSQDNIDFLRKTFLKNGRVHSEQGHKIV